MSYVNPPKDSLQNFTHDTYFSKTLNREVGYNVYLPPGYGETEKKYPAAYHIHGWTGNESTEIVAMEKVCRGRDAITVFINAVSSENEYLPYLFQIDSILIDEFIPCIESRYKISAARESRMISGMSMGGNMAFYYAVKHPGLFGSVVSYAGTFHHLFHEGSETVGVAPEKAFGLYEEMMRDERYNEENNILNAVRQNADKIRGEMKIAIHAGTADIVFCDSEIMHLYLNSLEIPHEYKRFESVGHELDKII